MSSQSFTFELKYGHLDYPRVIIKTTMKQTRQSTEDLLFKIVFITEKLIAGAVTITGPVKTFSLLLENLNFHNYI